MTDFAKLRLRAGGDPAMLHDILQMECRERYGVKLADTLERVPDWEFPSRLAGEQATADVLAEEHVRMLGQSAVQVLDMTCGLGIDVLHAAWAGHRVTALEIDAEKAECARRNMARAGVDVEVVCADSVRWLQETDRHFDVIFIDPARRDADGRRTYALADCSPDVVALTGLLKAKAQRVIVKASPMLDVSRVRRELSHDADILLVGTPDECRELCIQFPGSGRLEAVTLDKGVRHVVDFSEITDTLPPGTRLTAGQWIYEPWPSVMKAGQHGCVAAMTGTIQLGPDSHLFVSQDEKPSFPGRGYRVEEVHPFDKRSVRSLQGVEASVAVRGFPISAEELRKRLKAKECSSRRLWGVTDGEGRRLLVIAGRGLHEAR